MSPVMMLSSLVLAKSKLFRDAHVAIDNTSSLKNSIFSTENQGTESASNRNCATNYDQCIASSQLKNLPGELFHE